METKFWVRQARTSGFQGPLPLAAIGAAIDAKRMSADCEVRAAAVVGKAEVLDDAGWEPAWRRLGLPPPPPPKVDSTAVDGVVEPMRALLLGVRAESAYRSARRLAKRLMVVALVAIVTVGGIGVVMDLSAKSWWSALASLCIASLETAAVLLLYHAFQMLADVADCHLRHANERASGAIAPSSPDV